MAEAKLGHSGLTPQYRWNPIAARYIRPDGTFVPFLDLRDALQRVVLAGTDNLLGHGNDLARGSLTVSEWQRRMASDMKIQHLAASAEARGGWAQLTNADRRWVARQTRRQLVFLKRFASQVASGDQPLDGRFVTRVEMYGQAAGQISKEMTARVNKDAGMRFEQNILGQAEHSADCLEASRQGWVAIGTLTKPGQRDCLTRCQCNLAYAKELGAVGDNVVAA